MARPCLGVCHSIRFAVPGARRSTTLFSLLAIRAPPVASPPTVVVPSVAFLEPNCGFFWLYPSRTYGWRERVNRKSPPIELALDSRATRGEDVGRVSLFKQRTNVARR